LSILSRLENIKPFTEFEAWVIFKTAALAEAVGWTLLIASIIIKKYKLIGYKIAIPIAGQVHGSFFIIYFIVLIAGYSSLNWPRKKFLIAVLAGIPPYGTLIFETIASYNRKLDLARRSLFNSAYYQLTKNYKTGI
jgi:integral membrane protein